MSLRKTVQELAHTQANKVTRAVVGMLVKQLQQNAAGSGTVSKLNNDGTIKISYSDGTEISMTNAGGRYLKPGDTVVNLTNDMII